MFSLLEAEPLWPPCGPPSGGGGRSGSGVLGAGSPLCRGGRSSSLVFVSFSFRDSFTDGTAVCRRTQPWWSSATAAPRGRCPAWLCGQNHRLDQAHYWFWFTSFIKKKYKSLSCQNKHNADYFFGSAPGPHSGSQQDLTQVLLLQHHIGSVRQGGVLQLRLHQHTQTHEHSWRDEELRHVGGGWRRMRRRTMVELLMMMMRMREREAVLLPLWDLGPRAVVLQHWLLVCWWVD